MQVELNVLEQLGVYFKITFTAHVDSHIARTVISGFYIDKYTIHIYIYIYRTVAQIITYFVEHSVSWYSTLQLHIYTYICIYKAIDICTFKIIVNK